MNIDLTYTQKNIVFCLVFFSPIINLYFCQMGIFRHIFIWGIIFTHSLIGYHTNAQHTSSKQAWIDSVYASLSTREAIGQMFMVAAYSGGKNYNETQIRNLITNYHIGGLIFMQNDPVNQANLTNAYQRLSKTPLLIAMDAEWGLGMRLTGIKDFPRQMMLGAADDSMLVYSVGEAIARQCKRLGIHVNFAPVADVNNNPKNPVINARAFGENKYHVSKLAIAYMHGLQQNGIMACAKHFPGHGDTDVDSHKDLPTIRKSYEALDTLEFYPFRRMIEAGVKSVMVAHLEVPALEPQKGVPTSLSKNTITNELKYGMGFSGLVFTDALNMKGVTKFYKPGEVDVMAFVAGNDVLLFSEDVPTAIEKIYSAVDTSPSLQKQLAWTVKKILGAKYDAGLHTFTPISTANLVNDLNQDFAQVRNAVAENAITLVRDQHKLLPKLRLPDGRITYIGVNASQQKSTILFEALQQNIPTLRSEWFPAGTNAAYRQTLTQTLSASDVVIVGIHNLKFYPSGGQYGLDAQQIAFLKDCAKYKNVFFVLMGNPYIMKNFCEAGSILVGYEDDSITQSRMADVVLGKLKPKGKLPVTSCPDYTLPQVEEPVTTKPVASDGGKHVLTKTFFVEDAGVVSPEALHQLNMFIQRCIVSGAFPGCRILAAKDGKIFYDESFGYLTYEKTEKVTENTIYDLASITKILATNLAVMKLWEEKKIDLEKTISDYLPEFATTDKSRIQLKKLLLHQAGLKAWIPFYKETLDSTGNMKEELYATKPSETYSIPVTENIFLLGSYRDTIWERIKKSPLDSRVRYVYSDLDFIILGAIVEKITGKSLDVYVSETFYKPLGLKHTVFNPLNVFSKNQIAPTEQDVAYRNQLVHGYVHDPGAAMMGGVAGHAGLFSTAHDVAVLMQMLLNGGSYNGKQYFKKETVTYFTRYHSTISRRGLGFDKPAADPSDGGPAGNRVSGHAFGHLGFTGTCTWADPATGIVYVFLSNRVFPSADNSNITRLSVRTVVQDYLYESLGIGINKSRKELHRQQTGKN